MREIKFQLWDKDAQVMREVLGIDFEHKYAMCKDGTEFFHYSLDVHSLRQFTGRRDKNGKEIYADDIVIDSNGRYAVVYWNLDDCQFLVDFQADMEIEQVSSNHLICGNSWQNVELLK